MEINPNEISARITASMNLPEKKRKERNELNLVLTMMNRMIEEKEEVTQQINRTDQLLKQIEMSVNAKKETYVIQGKKLLLTLTWYCVFD